MEELVSSYLDEGPKLLQLADGRHAHRRHEERWMGEEDSPHARLARGTDEPPDLRDREMPGAKNCIGFCDQGENSPYCGFGRGVFRWHGNVTATAVPIDRPRLGETGAAMRTRIKCRHPDDLCTEGKCIVGGARMEASPPKR
jgi:hypothetical protein